MIKTIATLIGFLLIFFPDASKVNARNLCHPKIDNSLQNFVIAYGSLIETKSRELTNANANNAYPVIVNGFQRLWGINAGNYRGTFLTVIKKSGEFFNAVYYLVKEDEITNTDAREIGYCRTKINRNNLKSLGILNLAKGDFWIYTIEPNNLSSPSEQYPIIQSYVDIFISGCFEVQKRYQISNFAKMCITTTNGWSEYWINDRVHPRRPFDLLPNAREIDNLLNSYFPDYFDHKISN